MQAVDFYFAIGSRYSYLAASQIARIEAETGCRVEWHPLNSLRLLAMRGATPFQGDPVSGQYEWSYRERDAVRWADLYGIPFVEPRGRVEFDSELLALACTAARRLGAIQPYAQELFRAMFDGSVSLIDEAKCVEGAERCGLLASEFSRELYEPATAERLSKILQSALDAGAFGVPTFIAEGELFWGNDRLILLEKYLHERASWSRTTGGATALFAQAPLARKPGGPDGLGEQEVSGGPDRDAARQRYDRIAADYDCQLGFRSARIARIVEGLRKRAVAALRLEPGHTVLDVGCGTGNTLPRLVAAVGPEGRIVGVDQSRGMLEVAARRIEDQRWANVELIEAPIEDATLPSSDAAIFFFTHDLMRTPAALDNVLNSVRPDGLIVAAGFQRPSSWLGRLVVPTRRILGRYATTDEGVEKPWDLLGERMNGVTTESVMLGSLYIVAGRRPTL